MFPKKRLTHRPAGRWALRGGARDRSDARASQQSPAAGQQIAAGKAAAAAVVKRTSHRASTNVFASSST
jgi:hypothetical protein